MARFEQLNQYIELTIAEIINNQNICKLLNYPVDDPLSEPDIDDTSELFYKRIFPFPKMPIVEAAAGSYITVHIDNFHMGSDQSTKSGSIVFSVIVHNDLWRMTGTGMLRPYSILHEIDEIFNNKKVMGIKKVQFDRIKFIYINENYSGYEARYSIVSVN